MSPIHVAVRLFASYREAVGTRCLDLTLPPDSRVSDVLDALSPRIPSLRTAKGMLAVNQTYVTPEMVLHDGDEVALIPPVSGG